jgi:thiol-disulfide isomerase/thioredoxin
MKEIIFSLFTYVSFVTYAQKATVIKFDSVQKILESQNDEIQIINFWATWCGPCVKELQLFENLDKINTNIRVTLISLDFAEEFEKVNSFIKRKKITSTVLLLDEVDYNKWIDRVDQTWSGAIPATLILNSRTGKRKFVEKELLEGDLQKLINEVI